MNHGVWVVWVVPASNAEPLATSYRMCARCGYTQWTDTQQEGWQEVADSVLGTSCTDQQPPDPDKIGYTTPTP